MGFADNLINVANSMQQGTRNFTVTTTQRVLRLISGFFLGLVLSLIIQEFTQSGVLVLLFLTTFFTATVYKLLRNFSIFQIFVFDVICILIATSLRLYIMIAP